MARSRGFSLLEILIVLTLLLVLLAALISTPNHKKDLDEGVINFKTLLIFVKANAQNTGKPFKLVINDDVSVLWSPVPFEFPGIFQPFPALNDLVSSVTNLVNIKTKSEQTMWYADGSSDQAKFCVSSKNEEDTRKITVKLEETGKIRIK